jgi:hypothetical protein
MDQISPERTELKNTLAARPEGSLFYNEPNITISTKYLISTFNFKFYNIYSNQSLQQKEAEEVRKQFLFPYLDLITTPVNFSEFFQS